MEHHSTLPSDNSRATLTEHEAAQYIGMSVSFLRLGRARRTGPTYVQINRAIRYRVTDLDAFLDERRVRPSAPAQNFLHA